MRKPDFFAYAKNKGADQLCSNCTADQRLCFRFTDSTIHLFHKSGISMFYMFSWYKYLILNLVFSHLGFWSGNLFLIAPFPDLCPLVPF